MRKIKMKKFKIRKEKVVLYSHAPFQLILGKMIIILLISIEYMHYYKFIKENHINKNTLLLSEKIPIHNYSYENDKFAILTAKCSICGLFSFYIYYLGCVNKYILEGYVPIIDMQSYPNPYNNFTTTKKNPWEFLFEQPFGYTLQEVLNNAKHKYSFDCIQNNHRPSETQVYYNKVLIDFWHDISKKYIPIKNEIIIESNNIIQKLFGNYKNILGVKIRGTDYVNTRPKGHPVVPDIENVIIDIKNMSAKNNYDFIFFASEDEKIKARIISEFKDIIKYLNANKTINYGYQKDELFIKNKDVAGDLEYAKNYLMNIYILSKCTDIIMTRGSGGAGIIILTEGFRNSIIYNLGNY